MANNQPTRESGRPSLNYDWNLLGNARVAGEYLKQGEEGMPFARKSLELILSDAQISDPWIVNTVTDPEVLHKTIENQLHTYNQFKADQTVGDLLKYYNADILRYLGDSAGEVHRELKAFEGESYSGIAEKISEAKYIIEGKKYDRSSDKEVEQAKKVIEKYQKVLPTISTLESLRFGKFRTRVEEEVAKDGLRELYKPKEKPQLRLAA